MSFVMATPSPSRARLGVGTRVLYQGVLCTVRFLGRTHFADGVWVGLELSEPVGKNNGTVDSRIYFSCAPHHGLFCRPAYITVVTADNNPLSKPSRRRRRVSNRDSIINHGVPRKLRLTSAVPDVPRTARRRRPPQQGTPRQPQRQGGYTRRAPGSAQYDRGTPQYQRNTTPYTPNTNNHTNHNGNAHHGGGSQCATPGRGRMAVEGNLADTRTPQPRATTTRAASVAYAPSVAQSTTTARSERSARSKSPSRSRHSPSPDEDRVATFVLGTPQKWGGVGLRMDVPLYDPRFHSCDYEVGDFVRTRTGLLRDAHVQITGRVAYVGYCWEAPGLWIGINLKEPLGNTDGFGYFRCHLHFGCFVRSTAIDHAPSDVLASLPAIQMFSPDGDKTRVAFQDSVQGGHATAALTRADLQAQDGAQAEEERQMREVDLYLQCLQEQAERRRNIQQLEDDVERKMEEDASKREEDMLLRQKEQAEHDLFVAEEAQREAERMLGVEEQAGEGMTEVAYSLNNDSIDAESHEGSEHGRSVDSLQEEIADDIDKALLSTLEEVKGLIASLVNTSVGPRSFVASARGLRDTLVELTTVAAELQDHLDGKDRAGDYVDDHVTNDALDHGSEMLKAADAVKTSSADDTEAVDELIKCTTQFMDTVMLLSPKTPDDVVEVRRGVDTMLNAVARANEREREQVDGAIEGGVGGDS